MIWYSASQAAGKRGGVTGIKPTVPVRWVVVGIGDIAVKRVIPAILAEPRSRLHGVVSRDASKGHLHCERVWDNLEDALGDPGVDAVYLATPVLLHAPQSIAALEAGRHVLCEKPMAMTFTEALAMRDAAVRSGRTLGIAYYRRMYPKVRRAAILLEQGVIGPPVLAEINSHGWFQAEDGRRAWLLDPALAGAGPLYDIASHRIDVLNFLFGEPRRACGQLSNAVHQSRVEDAATLLIDYKAGVRGYVDVRWHSRIERDEFRIIGTLGEMILTPLSGPELTYPGGRESLPCHPNVHYPCIENFVDAIEGKAPLAASGESSLATAWVSEQVLRASASAPIPAP